MSFFKALAAVVIIYILAAVAFVAVVYFMDIQSADRMFPFSITVLGTMVLIYGLIYAENPDLAKGYALFVAAVFFLALAAYIFSDPWRDTRFHIILGAAGILLGTAGFITPLIPDEEPQRHYSQSPQIYVPPPPPPVHIRDPDDIPCGSGFTDVIRSNAQPAHIFQASGESISEYLAEKDEEEFGAEIRTYYDVDVGPETRTYEDHAKRVVREVRRGRRRP